MKRSAWVGVVAAAAVVAGVVGVIAFGVGRDQGREAGQREALTSPAEWEVNENNLTVGQAGDLGRFGQSPDLIAMTTQDGVEGYAYSIQVLLRAPNPPREFTPGSREIPIYDVSGTELLGYALIH